MTAKALSTWLRDVQGALPDLFTRYAAQIGGRFLMETKKRTPVDYGNLRSAWSLMPLERKGRRYIITITNPQKYSAFVEMGYAQRPGMILRMRKERGRLRFKEFLGYSAKYGVGESTKEVQPDENGDYIIVTRKRFIPGRFMARDALDEMKKQVRDGNIEIKEGLVKIFREKGRKAGKSRRK